MTHDILRGMPYVPGVAAGELHRGVFGARADQLVVCRQYEVEAFSVPPAGFIVVDAAPFSHGMIRLLGLGVPTVLIDARQAEWLEEGRHYCLSGHDGTLTSNIDDVTQVVASQVEYVASQGVYMADGQAVHLYASIRQANAAARAKALGATGIGLVRTEFLLPSTGAIPDTTFYRRAFREICEAASPIPVTFRLLDVATDKIPPWLSVLATADDLRAYQGVRLYRIDAVRLVMQAQIEALTELAKGHDIRILIPYLTRVEEHDYWRAVVTEKLNTVAVGAMLETPASVLDIDAMLEHADFVAVGCNDLMQCLYSADRDRPDLRHYLDPYAPVLYRLLQQSADRAGSRLASVQLCGVLPQVQGVLPVLLGLGYSNFSVDTTFIPYLAELAAKFTHAECENLAEQICAAITTQDVLEILRFPSERHQPFLI